MPEQPNHLARSEGAAIDKCFVVSAPVVDSELLLCHGTTVVVRGMCDLNLQLSKVRFIQQSHLDAVWFFLFHYQIFVRID